jgi:hypothetical protein
MGVMMRLTAAAGCACARTNRSVMPCAGLSAARLRATQSSNPDLGWGPLCEACRGGAMVPATREANEALPETLVEHGLLDTEQGITQLQHLVHVWTLRCYKRGLLYHPEHNFVAGLFLATLKEEAEETAFWLLAAVFEEGLAPPHYHTPLLPPPAAAPGGAPAPAAAAVVGVDVEVRVFMELASEREAMAQVLDGLQSLGVELEPILRGWFARLYVHTLPWPTLLHWLDCFLVEGARALHRAAFAIFTMLGKKLASVKGEKEARKLLDGGVRGLHDARELMKLMLDIKLPPREVEQKRERTRMRFRQQQQQQQQQQMPQQQMPQQQMPQMPQHHQQQMPGGGGGAEGARWGAAMSGLGLGGGQGGGGLGGMMMGGVVSRAMQQPPPPQQHQQAHHQRNPEELSEQAAEIVREARRMAEEIRAEQERDAAYARAQGAD